MFLLLALGRAGPGNDRKTLEARIMAIEKTEKRQDCSLGAELGAGAPETIPDAVIQQVEAQIGSTHAARMAKLKAWFEAGINPYRVTRFLRSHDAAGLQAHYAGLAPGEKTGDVVTIAGRIMIIRNSGMFIVIQDASGRIQTFNDVKNLAPERLEQLHRFDLGDIVGVRGVVRRTPRGELTIDVEEYLLIAKSLEPLPEKYHGIADPELEVRERHKSIVSDDEVRKRLVNRSRIVSAIRRTLEEDGFLEVETPSLHAIAGGAAAKPFVTHHNALDTDFCLRIAPELYLKRLIASGISDKIFEIGKNFRNEGLSFKHNPEFTSMEAYVAYANYEDMIVLTEKLVAAAVRKANDGKTVVSYKGVEIDFTGPWPRKSMTELVREHTGVDFAGIMDAAQAREAARKIGVETGKGDGWGKVVEAVFSARVEGKIVQPIHVTSIPAEISPLAKPNPEDPRFAERFETYVAGYEIANAFSELNDPFIQHRFFKAQAMQHKAGDEEATLPDDDYVRVLEFGLPATGGLGIGIDRLVMLLTDARHIRQVILFPTLRPDNNPQASICATIDPL